MVALKGTILCCYIAVPYVRHKEGPSSSPLIMHLRISDHRRTVFFPAHHASETFRSQKPQRTCGVDGCTTLLGRTPPIIGSVRCLFRALFLSTSCTQIRGCANYVHGRNDLDRTRRTKLHDWKSFPLAPASRHLPERFQVFTAAPPIRSSACSLWVVVVNAEKPRTLTEMLPVRISTNNQEQQNRG